ncbi:HAAS signaling domain-containing protein [Actinoplanes couchii]|nr:hypothetical protein [Actinoplanes couchii]MDR6322216.1 putative membrane protein [Actinoplanes couchii]
MTETDHLIAVYLARVDQAAIRLPAARREELVNDLREHIEIARSESEVDSEASIRTILDRLGDPESIVAAADTQTDLPRVTVPPPVAAPPGRNPKTVWIIAGALAVAGVVVLFCLFAAFAMNTEISEPAPGPAMTAPAEPAVELPAQEPTTTAPSGS